MNLSWFKNGRKSETGPLEPDSGYVLDVEGRKVLALKVADNIVKEISGQASTMGVIARLKAKIMRHDTENDGQWLVVTNIQNPSLTNYDRFGSLVAQELTDMTGVPVSASKLAVSGTSAVARIEKPPDPPEQMRNIS